MLDSGVEKVNKPAVYVINSVSQNFPTSATVLRGYLTESDGDVVLSTTLPRKTSWEQAGEQRIKEKKRVLRGAVQRRREGR